jgi:hypothetical protein
MRKALFFVALFWCTAVFGQHQGPAFWQLLRSGRGTESVGFGGVRDISYRNDVCVSLLLPLEDGRGGLDRRFGEFYRGALLAIEELRAQGVGVRVRLFDTPRDTDAVAAILDSWEFEGTDVVIGPVYADGMEQVVDWARARGAAVVSPLTVIDACGGEVFYQMAPAPSTKYDKLTALLSEAGVNVVYMTTAQPEQEMDSELLPLLGDVPQVAYSAATTGAELEALVDRGASKNIFVVSCRDQQAVDGILGRISSMYSDLRSRSAISSELQVVGSASWARFSSSVVDRELYFKLGVCYVTNYHVDRTDARVRAFDSRYIAQFGDVPPSAPLASGGRDNRVLPYAYRGYDAVKLFVGAAATMGSDFTSKVNAEGHELLQVSYRFEQSMWGDWQNVNWPLVVYRPDYRIEIY